MSPAAESQHTTTTIIQGNRTYCTLGETKVFADKWFEADDLGAFLQIEKQQRQLVIQRRRECIIVYQLPTRIS